MDINATNILPIISSLLDSINIFASWRLNRSLEREKKKPCLCSNLKNISIYEYREISAQYKTVLISENQLTVDPEINLSDNFNITCHGLQKAFCIIDISNANPDGCIMDLAIYINDCMAFDHLSLNNGHSFSYLLCFDMSIFNKKRLKKRLMKKRQVIKYRYNGINNEKIEQQTILNIYAIDYEPEIKLVGKQISNQKITKS